MVLKPFQLDDLARLSLLDGAILAWACGTGKAMACYAWPLMKCGWTGRAQVKAPVLILTSEDLHKQTAEEGRKWFGIETLPLSCADLPNPAPGFYIGTYGAAEFIPPQAFECVVVDEGDKIKKTSSDIGRIVRNLKPKYRLVCTATPFADRLQDLFWLCSWVAENDPIGKKRLPYGPRQDEYSGFAGRYQVEGQYFDREIGGLVKSAEVSNLLGLWRITCPIVLRRTMEETGEKIVGLNHQIIHCPLGARQRVEYERALLETAEVGMRMNVLRRITGGALWPNPKLATAIELIALAMERGEQVLVASEFRGPNDALSELLCIAHIPHVLMDGRTHPAVRANLAETFKSGEIPVALIGLKSGAEGHSYPKCNNVILLNYSWEYKKLPQVIHRARRINSEKDLTVWSLVCQGTIEERMAQLVTEEKGGSADLVLDGVWPTVGGAPEQPISGLEAMDEGEIENRWPHLKARLQGCYLVFASRHGHGMKAA